VCSLDGALNELIEAITSAGMQHDENSISGTYVGLNIKVLTFRGDAYSEAVALEALMAKIDWVRHANGAPDIGTVVSVYQLDGGRVQWVQRFSYFNR
jgi:hypothetical protein